MTTDIIPRTPRRFRPRRRRKAALPIQLGIVAVAAAAIGLFAIAESAGLLGRDASPEGGLLHRRQLDSASGDDSLRWPNWFSKDEMRSGGFLLNGMIMLYMFAGLAIVCDDYFVASLDEICVRLDISDDVAGATFMAAGGSAPEFFTSLIGVFFVESDVGFGTIVGSASFNVLFVIGLCAYFSGYDILPLTWYPLARDSSYYLVALATLLGVTNDKLVSWYDAMALVLLYVGYVGIMFFDPQIRRWAMKNLDRSQVSDAPNRVTPVTSTEMEKGNSSVGEPSKQESTTSAGDEDEPDDSWPEWPDNTKERIIFIINAPLNFAFAATIPNCAVENKKKYFMVTFWFSVGWIGLLSYVMVLMAEDLGNTVGLEDEAMGVTILAMGTSIPDAVSSLLVAREGHGDMALSSSIGSNVFDVTFGLPVPWLIKTAIIDSGDDIKINANGMGIQVGTLMGMVVIVVLSVHLYGWKISKPLGLLYFLLYFVFVTIALCCTQCVFPVC